MTAPQNLNAPAKRPPAPPPEPPIKNGTDALRVHLNMRHKRGMSFAKIAGEINEAIAAEANRNTAGEIADGGRCRQQRFARYRQTLVGQPLRQFASRSGQRARD